MKLSKYGFRLDLLGFSSFLSVLGIIVSIIGIIGGIALFVVGSHFTGSTLKPFCMVFGGVLLILMIPYIIMWIFLKIKTNKQEINGIEKIGKVYSYVCGSLEITVPIAGIIAGMIVMPFAIEHYPNFLPSIIVVLICSAIYPIFAILKIHGIRVEEHNLLGIYLGFRYVLFIISVIAEIVLGILTRQMFYLTFVYLIIGIAFFILDIGLTVILHSIRVDRENTAGTGTEVPMKNI